MVKKIMPTKYLQNMHELVLKGLNKKNKIRYMKLTTAKKIIVLEKLYKKGTFKFTIRA